MFSRKPDGNRPAPAKTLKISLACPYQGALGRRLSFRYASGGWVVLTIPRSLAVARGVTVVENVSRSFSGEIALTTACHSAKLSSAQFHLKYGQILSEAFLQHGVEIHRPLDVAAVEQ